MYGKAGAKTSACERAMCGEQIESEDGMEKDKKATPSLAMLCVTSGVKGISG